MELGAIGVFLSEEGVAHTIDHRFTPPRLVVDSTAGVTLCVCVSDGELYLEDLTKIRNAVGYVPLIKVPLADPHSLDKLLAAIHEHAGKEAVDNGRVPDGDHDDGAGSRV